MSMKADFSKLPEPRQLPAKGFGRAKDILPFLPFGKTELWRRSKSGLFVAPIKLSEGITCWDYALIHKWLDDQSKPVRLVTNDTGA